MADESIRQAQIDRLIHNIYQRFFSKGDGQLVTSAAIETGMDMIIQSSTTTGNVTIGCVSGYRRQYTTIIAGSSQTQMGITFSETGICAEQYVTIVNSNQSSALTVGVTSAVGAMGDVAMEVPSNAACEFSFINARKGSSVTTMVTAKVLQGGN